MGCSDRIAWTLATVLCLGGVPARAAALVAGPGVVSVTDAPYHADPTGVRPSLHAIQRALNDVGVTGTGGVVFVPAGTFKVNGPLVVPPNTSLVGVFQAPSRSGCGTPHAGTMLLADVPAASPMHPGQPFITLQGPSSTLEGVTVYYPGQTDGNAAPVQFPPTVAAGGGDNVSIVNVTLLNPWFAVDFATNYSGRHLINGLYGQPLSVGIKVDKCHDVGRIKNVHFWNFCYSSTAPIQKYIAQNATSFWFQTTDWEVVEDIFSWDYSVGIRLDANPATGLGATAVMTNVQLDQVDVAIDAIATPPLPNPSVTITNFTSAPQVNGANRIGVRGSKSSNPFPNLTLQGATFFSNDPANDYRGVVSWDAGGWLNLQNVRFMSWDHSWPAVAVRGNHARVMVQNSFFSEVGNPAIDGGPIAVLVDSSVDRAMVTGCMLTGNAILPASASNLLTGVNQP